MHLASNPSSSIAVFLGPSLRRHEAEEILAADYHPPARRGDIYRIIPSGIKTIILIDGFFHSTPSVWPREILDAIGEGIRVLGASSMGALRAAELHEFGMIGCGTIFEWYRDGLIDGDDEVALWHGPQETDFCPLSEPLVNIRATLKAAVEASCITDTQARQLLLHAKQAYYPERSYNHLLTSSIFNSWPAKDQSAYEQFVLTKSVNLKLLDAIAVLRRCAEQQQDATPTIAREELQPELNSWQLSRVLFTGFRTSNDIVLGEILMRQVKEEPALLARMWKVLSTRAFLVDWAQRKRISLPENARRIEFEKWETSHDVSPGSPWLQANGLTTQSFRRLLGERVLAEWLISQGPRHFGLTDSSGAKAPALILENSSQLSCKSPASEQQELVDDDKLAERSRPFLLDWARQCGVSCPVDVLYEFAEQSELKHPLVSEIPASDVQMAEHALTEWMVDRGPAFFGFDWLFEYGLLRELQICGIAAELLSRGGKG